MKVFVGSSVESLDNLRTVAYWIEEAGHEAIPWDGPDLFLPGDNTFLKLIEISKTVDAAIFVFGEDDQIWYRQDAMAQPRDNILIEYGLFAGSLGPKRSIICRVGAPRIATDLHGIIHVNMAGPQEARLRVLAWARNLSSDKENPAISQLVIEKIVLKQKLEATEGRLAFEEQKASDLQLIISRNGLVDFGDYEDAHSRWKLLFHYDYFWGIAALLESHYPSPTAWRNWLEACGASQLSDMIGWDHMMDLPRTRVYVAKVLRLLRVTSDGELYARILKPEPEASDLTLKADELARQCVLALRLSTPADGGPNPRSTDGVGG